MAKIDFKKEYEFYHPSKKDFSIVNVPAMNFLMVDGHGDPNIEPFYSQAVEALYAVAYKLKFAVKKESGMDYVVPPLEGLWWAENMEAFTTSRDKSLWDWTMMIMQPEWVHQELFEKYIELVGSSKEIPALSKMRFECYAEGLSVQILHIGTYDDEAPTLARLHHGWLLENGYAVNGKHHEIYLSDPRRVTADKLKTILRQPIRKINNQ